MVEFEASDIPENPQQDIEGELYIYVVYNSYTATSMRNEVAKVMNDAEVIVADMDSQTDRNANVAWVKVTMATAFVDKKVVKKLRETFKSNRIQDVFISCKKMEENNVLRRRILGR